MSEYDLTAWWAPFLAFAAGIVAFASPCVLPLVPGYLSFVTAAGDGRGSVPSPARRPNTLPIFLFVAGFSVVFTSLGAFAGVFVPIVRSSIGQRVAGLVVVGVGVFLLLYAFRAGSASLYGEGRPLLGRVRRGCRISAWDGVRGGVDALHRTGACRHACARHGAVGSRAKRVDAVRVLDGPGVPFILIGLGIGGLMRRLGFLQRQYRAIAGVSGSMLVAIGLLLVSGAWVRVMSPLLRLVNSFEPPI